MEIKYDSKVDLRIDRYVDLPPEKIWQAWTVPELVVEWFCPKPWSVSHCEIDLYPGGKFITVMNSPEGEKFPNCGCFLEVIPNRKLVWTDLLLPGFRPADNPESGANLFFTAMIILSPNGTGTNFTAIAMHRNEDDKRKHEEMGFSVGWNICLDQLIEVVKSRRI